MVPQGIWNEARSIRIKMNRIARARRTSGWLTDEVLAGEPFIDAAIIDRGAWSLDIWAFTSPQHGGSVLDLNNRLYSISIAPEYRLKESGHYVPVKLCQGGKEFTFYWLPEERRQ